MFPSPRGERFSEEWKRYFCGVDGRWFPSPRGERFSEVANIEVLQYATFTNGFHPLAGKGFQKNAILTVEISEDQSFHPLAGKGFQKLVIELQGEALNVSIPSRGKVFRSNSSSSLCNYFRFVSIPSRGKVFRRLPSCEDRGGKCSGFHPLAGKGFQKTSITFPTLSQPLEWFPSPRGERFSEE